MSEYSFTDEMGEISGFGGDGDAGDSYEQACRDMVTAGAEWLDDNPDAEISARGIKGVMGLVDFVSEDAERLEEVMVEAAEESGPDDGGPTGAMMHACFRHIMYIEEHGWDAYVEKMEGKDDA